VFLTGPICFFCNAISEVWDPSHVVKVKVVLVSRRQYLVGSSVGTSGREMLGISAGTWNIKHSRCAFSRLPGHRTDGANSAPTS
jgi:hypothetical protein